MGKPSAKPPGAKDRSKDTGGDPGEERHSGGDFFGSEYEGHGGQPGEDAEGDRGSNKTKSNPKPSKR